MTRTRLARTTRRLANGTQVTTTKLVQAPVLEWRLQAAAVRALRSHPAYGQTFTLAGDQNASRRGPQAQMQAKATGLAPGEPDLRLYISSGRLCSIEYKAARGRLSPEQVARHDLLARLGFTVAVVKAVTEDEATEKTLALLAGWSPANDNKPWRDSMRLATVLEAIKAGEFVKWDREPGASFLVRAEAETDMVSEENMVIGDVVEIVPSVGGRRTIRRAVVARGAR